MMIFVQLGTKLCKKCKQRKPIKGGWQSKLGNGFICAECKVARAKA
jgi:hypothetical protein